MGKKIIITEEEKIEIKRLYEQPINHDYLEINSLSDTLNTASNYGIELRRKAQNSDYQVTWEEVDIDPEVLPYNIRNMYPKYVPELLSGVEDLKNFDSSTYLYLLQIANLIEEKSGLNIIVTAGKDKYHQEERSRSSHNQGKAIDFVIDGTNGDENQFIIESAILDIIRDGNRNLSFINEFKKNTKGTGGHFHISLVKEFNYYHFFDEGLRKKGDKGYLCCGKKSTLTFNGDGSDIFDRIIKDARSKEKKEGKYEPDRYSDEIPQIDMKPVSEIPNDLPKQEINPNVSNKVTPTQEPNKKRLFRRK